MRRNMDITFIVDATPAQYATWLEKKNDHCTIPTEHGHIDLQRARRQSVNDSAPERVVIEGIQIVIRDVDAQAEQISTLPVPYMTFNLLEVGGNRTEVTATCHKAIGAVLTRFVEILSQ